MFLAPPLCVGNEHLLNRLLCNVKIRLPQFDDGSWQVQQISLGCRVQNVECSRDGKSASLCCSAAQSVIHEEKRRMHLNGQADCFRLSVAKPNQWINDEWRANRKPRGGRTDPFSDGFRRARMLKLNKRMSTWPVRIR